MTMRHPEDEDERRVVISGIGAITAAGPTAPDFWQALIDGSVHLSALEAAAGVEPPRPAAAGAIRGYDGPNGVPQGFLERLDRAGRFALDAAIQAVGDARVGLNEANAYAVGAITGTAHPGGGESWAALGSGISGAAIGLSIRGPVFTINAGGASGLAAVAAAAQMIRAGTIRAALAIGAEAPLRPEIWNAYEAAGLLDPQADPRGQMPFDVRRRGLALGEGAAALWLEDRQLAVQRGARIYAEVAGEAITAGGIGDGQPPTDIDIARHAIGAALRVQELGPQTIDVLVASGAGTPRGDARETDIIERSFGRRTLDMYITAITPNIGYTVGASGALGLLAAALTVAESRVFPHATFREVDIECNLDVTTRLREDRIAGAMATAYGAHGQNAAVALMPHSAVAGDELPLL